MRSHSPSSRNFVGSDVEGIISLPLDCQALHSRHVLTTGLIMFSLTSSSPAAFSRCRIFGSEACHHRRCSFRSSLCTTEGSYDLKFLRLTWMLNLVQSGSLVSPLPLDVQVRLVFSACSPSGCTSPCTPSGFGGADEDDAAPPVVGGSSILEASCALMSALGCVDACARGSLG